MQLCGWLRLPVTILRLQSLKYRINRVMYFIANCQLPTVYCQPTFGEAGSSQQGYFLESKI
jgi:hypothetical protein